jgi:hypothetical protein
MINNAFLVLRDVVTDQDPHVNYKGRKIDCSISHTGSNGPYNADFSVLSQCGDIWVQDHHHIIETLFDDREHARAAALQAACEWIDQQR